jgi:hypothetical protein
MLALVDEVIEPARSPTTARTLRCGRGTRGDSIHAIGGSSFGLGGGIEWRNGLDYGADTLKMMADEQRPVSGRDLVAFQSALKLSTSETAALLGLAERTVRAYRRAQWLPQSVAIAIRAIRASNTVLAAHYRPVGYLARGRPTKQTTKTAA